MAQNYTVWLQENNSKLVIDISSGIVRDSSSGLQLYSFKNGRLHSLTGNSVLNIKADGRILDSTNNQIGYFMDYPQFMVEYLQSRHTSESTRQPQNEGFASSGASVSGASGKQTDAAPDMASSWVSSSTGKPFFTDEPFQPKSYDHSGTPVRNSTPGPTAQPARNSTPGPTGQPVQQSTAAPKKKSHTWIFILILGVIIFLIVRNNSGNQDEKNNILANREAVALELRKAIVNHEDIFTVKYRSNKKIKYNFDLIDETSAMFEKAVEHTGNPDEGDPLALTVNYSATGSSEEDKQGYINTVTFNLEYMTTKEQENKLRDKIKSTVKSMNLTGKSDYEKARLIYMWICNHVTYDYARLNDDSYTLKYTAYNAMFAKTAVCSGYAQLFYRMALTAGLECRITVNTSCTHAWNYVKINGTYYICDSTWDSGKVESGYEYFLKGSYDFKLHDDLNMSLSSLLSQYQHLVNLTVTPVSSYKYR